MKFLTRLFHEATTHLKKRVLRKMSDWIESFLCFMNNPSVQRCTVLASFLFVFVINVFAQSNAGISSAAQTISQYQDQVKALMNAIGAIIALVGAFQVFYKMQSGDQDVKKTIMLTIGGCVAFVALGQALPMFFGVNGGN